MLNSSLHNFVAYMPSILINKNNWLFDHLLWAVNVLNVRDKQHCKLKDSKDSFHTKFYGELLKIKFFLYLW